MIGLPAGTDWATLTYNMRMLDAEKPYKDIREDWQAAIDVGIMNFPRVYLQLPRGHDKTERYAWWSMLWMETTKASRGYAVGVDRDNAKLFRDAAKKIKALHPQLFSNIEIEKHVVFSKESGSYIETISSDVNSAYGLNFDLLIVNDFHAWEDYTFWEVLWSACEKRPDIRVWMESNALTLGTKGAEWVSRFRKWVKEKGTLQQTTLGTKEWFYFNPPKFLAGWQIDKLQQWKDTLLPSTFKRLIENQDTSGAESFVTEEQVTAIETLAGPEKERASAKGPVVTTVDLGLKKDSTAVATVQLLPAERVEVKVDGKTKLKKKPQRLVLLALDVLVGTPDNPVLIEDAEKLAFEHRARYKSGAILCDPWQAISIVQRNPGICEEWPFTAASVGQLTSILYRVVADGNLAIYPHAGKAVMSDGEEWDLKKELTHAVTKDTSYGTRVDHRAGGFSDRLMALGMACHNLLGGTLPKKVDIKEEDVVEKNSAAEIIDEWMTQLENPSSAGKALALR